MASLQELDAMRLAIALSARGLGTTSPNPPVGCVILDAHGHVAGTGYHRRKGEPHAEAHALQAAGRRAEGGTAVVTLEPCNHAGLTPACRQVLVDANISRVVIALIDPTSRDGGGAAALDAAGLDVETGVLSDEARLVLGPWLDALAKRRPIVTAAYTIAGDGPRPLDRSRVAALRTGFDAVMLDGDRLEEGRPNGHGRTTFKLPAYPPATEPTERLEELYDGGTRTLLIADTAGLEPSWAGARVVDRLLIYMTIDAQDRAVDTSPGRLIPSDFRLTKVSRAAGHIRIECQAMD